MIQPTQTRLIKAEASSHRGMVATKDRLATLAGVAILEAGGNAIDAAVAACFAIGVVEPTSSGIGGGGYLVFQIGERGGVFGFPMRGPLEARPDMYELTGDLAVGSFGWAGVKNDENFKGPKSIATPGAVAGLCEAHKLYGRLPLRDVIDPALEIARNGFSPSWFNLYSIGLQVGHLLNFEELRRIFIPDGEMPTGNLTGPALLKQTDLANVLDSIGREGPDAFYRGDIAKLIVADIRDAGGILSLQDLEAYKPFVWNRGLEFNYRDYMVRVPPYGSAGITTAMTLRMMDGMDVSSKGHNSVDMLHSYISSARLAYADRFTYLGDQTIVDVPWKGLLSDTYTQRRRDSISELVPVIYEPGDPWQDEGRRPTKQLAPSSPGWDLGTTHLSVIDGEGSAVSLTNTLMGGFGSGVVPKGTGVVMNNGMLWFDTMPGRINSIAPGKYPLNNMTPALVLDGDGVKMSVGASGGRRITNCVTQLIIKILDFGMGPQDAIDSPRVDCSMPFTSVDPRLEELIRDGLESRGHQLMVIDDKIIQTGFASFASPVAIVRNSSDEFRGGVDTFHSAYAAGL